MARVTMIESEKMAQSMKGLRIFKSDVDVIYRYVFPVDENGEAIMYATPVHQINLGTQSGSSKCVSGFVATDNNGDYILDPVSGKPINDGSCPYCETQLLCSKILAIKMDAFRELNPESSEKEQKEYFKKIVKDIPVNKPKIQRGFIVARIEADKTGQLVKGNGEVANFEIGFLPMTDNQYEKKFKPALAQFDGVISWIELLFAYPQSESKMEAAKDMGIQPAIKKTLDTYPGTKQAIMDAIANIDLDSVEDKVFSFRSETIQAIERKLASKQSELVNSLTEEQKEELSRRIEDKMINAEAATLEDILNVGNDGDDSDDSDELI